MGKVKWGAIVAVVAAIVVVVLADRGVFRSDREIGETAGMVDTSVNDEQRGQDEEIQDDDPAVMQEVATDTGEARDADDGEAGDAAGRAPESDKNEPVASDSAGDESDDGKVGEAGEAAERAPEPDENEPVASEPAGDESDDGLQEDAESFVRQLAEPSDEPVVVEDAEGFVGADRPLTSETSESEAPGATLPEAEELDDVGTSESDVAGTDARSAAEPGSPEAGTDSAPRPETRDSGTKDAPAADARESGTPEASQSEVELPMSEQAPVTIAKLLGAEEAIASDAVFYVHTVQPEDIQGIWGIVHGGILENFAAGVAVHRGESTESYRVDIPRHADERRSDSSSSFLGKLIFDKTQKSYVYNYQTDRLGRNPDLIVSGQEIVIVSFTPEELIEIYKHFVQEEEDRGGDS